MQRSLQYAERGTSYDRGVVSHCDVCHKVIVNEEKHMFFGHGFFAKFCSEHCPGEVDGWPCEKCEEERVEQTELGKDDDVL